jgi:thioredoxin-dependent peroxiredoxin
MPQVTLKGNPVKLPGNEVKVGDNAPDFVLQDAALADVRLGDSAGKTRIVVAIPSLDTPVCAMETKRFNDEAAKLGNVEVLVVSMDLPFGQKRWCGAEGVSNVKCLSDHRSGKFGRDYGVLVEGGPFDRVFARAVFVVGPDNTVKYAEYVKEIAEHPNYEAVLAAAKS